MPQETQLLDLETIEDKLDEILDRLDRLEEAIQNVSTPGSGYGIEIIED